MSPTNKLKVLNATQSLALRDSAQKDQAKAGGYAYVPEPLNTPIYGKWTRGQADSLAKLGGTDWIDKAMRTGMLQVANISATGR